jgi:hypothetical protein
MYSALAGRLANGGPSHGLARCLGKRLPKPKPPKRLLCQPVAKSPPKGQYGRKRCGATSLAQALASQPPAKKARDMPKAAIGATKLCCDHVDNGSVFESDLEHSRRHKAEGRAGGCLRCIFLSNPGELERAAQLPRKGGGCATWLEPRPCHKGGSWALGCRICAWHVAEQRAKGQPLAASIGGPKRKHKKKLSKDPAMRRRSQARFSKFASFTFRQHGQLKKTIEQHGNSQAHELAYRAMLRKELACEIRPLPEAAPNPVAQQAFKGRVPKPQDWLDSFVETANFVSWRKQAKLRMQKSGQACGEPLAPTPEGSESKASGGSKSSTPAQPVEGQPLEGQPLAALPGGSQPLAAPRETLENLRKRRRKQTLIMAEVVRRKHRKILRMAKFCTLALDEAQGRKLVHFRCDYHKAPWYHQGTLGVFKVGPKTPEEGAEDHAQRALRRLDEFLSKFCTPLRKASLGTECDNELKGHLFKIVVTISADGGFAERRAIILACAQGFPFDWACSGPGLTGNTIQEHIELHRYIHDDF